MIPFFAEDLPEVRLTCCIEQLVQRVLLKFRILGTLRFQRTVVQLPISHILNCDNWNPSSTVVHIQYLREPQPSNFTHKIRYLLRQKVPIDPGQNLTVRHLPASLVTYREMMSSREERIIPLPS
uniref:(northern house mosquito) hypothetical protein n=1 Tax=Culex pipiens TaxID=7175 RepID=A0A8D8DXL4_CULPI